MTKTLITLLTVLFACAVSTMSAPYNAHKKPEPPTPQESDSLWDELWKTTEQAAIRLKEAMEVTAPFMDFDNKSLDQKREAIGNYASFLRKVIREERDSYSQERIEAEAPDTTYCHDRGSSIDWNLLRVPAEGLNTQPLIDEHIATFSEIGPLYLQCPGYDLWERLDMEDHRRKLFDTFFTPEGTYIMGCVLRNGEFVDMQDFDSTQKWDYVEEHQHEIDSVRLQFNFADPGKIRMITLDTQNNRATVGNLDFTLLPDRFYGVQLTIEKHDREQSTAGDRFIEAVNTLDNGRKTPYPDTEIRFPELRKYTQGLTSAIAELDACIVEAKAVSEEGIIPLLERIESCESLHSNAQRTYSKHIRVYHESQGQIELYYIGESQPRQVIVTKAVERQEE